MDENQGQAFELKLRVDHNDICTVLVVGPTKKIMGVCRRSHDAHDAAAARFEHKVLEDCSRQLGLVAFGNTGSVEVLVPASTSIVAAKEGFKKLCHSMVETDPDYTGNPPAVVVTKVTPFSVESTGGQHPAFKPTVQTYWRVKLRSVPGAIWNAAENGQPVIQALKSIKEGAIMVFNDFAQPEDTVYQEPENPRLERRLAPQGR